jgi:hypothetical protein
MVKECEIQPKAHQAKTNCIKDKKNTSNTIKYLKEILSKGKFLKY